MKKLLLLMSAFLPSVSCASIFDMGEHSGFIRDSAGNYSHVSSNGTVRSLSSNTALVVKEAPVFQTPKGNFPIEITRTANIDLARVGKSVVKLARGAGTVGVAPAR